MIQTIVMKSERAVNSEHLALALQSVIHQEDGRFVVSLVGQFVTLDAGAALGIIEQAAADGNLRTETGGKYTPGRVTYAFPNGDNNYGRFLADDQQQAAIERYEAWLRSGPSTYRRKPLTGRWTRGDGR